MNNYDNILPDPLQVPGIVAFDILCKQRLDAIQLDALLVYMIDTVNSSALYWLAEQFDLLGYRGWKMADTDEKKRALIKNAIELHRYKGTIYALKKALYALGYPNVVITEHVTSDWATFKLQMGTGDDTLNPQLIADIVSVVNEYKNVRSHLVGIEWSVIFNDDSVIITDESYEGPAEVMDDAISVGGDFRYNGLNSYNGDRNYSSDTDILELTITP